jgi:hypothetical protein
VTITVSVPEELAPQAAAQGLSIEAFVERLAQQALDRRPEPHEVPARSGKASNLVELFALVRGLLSDEEVDTLFARNADTARPLDLS